MHFHNTAENTTQFFNFFGHNADFFLCQAQFFSVFNISFHFLQATDRLRNCCPVSQHTTQPAVINIKLATTFRSIFYDIFCLMFCSNEQNLTTCSCDSFQCDQRTVQQWCSFIQIDDMNFIFNAINIWCHQWIPATCVVTEMNSGLE